MKRMMRIKACIAASLTLCLLLAGHVMSVRAAAPDTEKAPVSENSYPVFDFESKTVKLNSGYDMPILGLGMFALSDSQAENSTYWALKAGFRLIDTARIYGNEAAVGRGLQKAIEEGVVTRDEVLSPRRCGPLTLIMVMRQ